MNALEELFGLTGRVALVTGASSGLGAEMARALASAGAAVGLVARRAERLEELAKELSEQGSQCCVAAADVTDSSQLEAAIEQVESELGPIWVLVHAAGIAIVDDALDQTREDFDSVLAVNLTAGLESAKFVGQRMIERGIGGRIIQVSSILGQGASPVHPGVAYVASKGALNQITRQLAIEWAPHGITVNAIAPAYFPTEMTVVPETGEIDPDDRVEIEARTPMRRLGQAAELRTATLFLAAPASSYVTGIIVPVDGGWTAW